MPTRGVADPESPAARDCLGQEKKRPMHMKLRGLIPLCAALLAVLAAVVPSLAASGESLPNVRDATAIYTNPTAALAGGYELLTDAADIACIEEPGQGAMGIHFVKGSLVEGGKIDPTRPQALVYERQGNGRLQLVAVEYVAIQAAWDATHTAPPSLFGQKFMLSPAGNRFGLPAFYSLHAWIWKDNPKGTFEMWNPRVKCPAGPQADTDAAGAAMDQMPTDH
jgi:hypothetical protein